MIEYDELAELLQQGESEYVEFKTRLTRHEDIARLLVGFANSYGGRIIVGVDDQGKVIGLSDAALSSTARRVTDIGKSLLPLPASTQLVVYNGLNVLVIEVLAAPPHYRPIRTATGQAYVRRNERTVPAAQAVDIRLAAPRRVTLFVAMSFHFEDEPALVDYFEAIKRAAAKMSLPIQVDRMDLLEGDYEISNEMIGRIRAADIVLADFTLNSPNVYFEAGIARGSGKYLIRTARNDTELPFDVRTWRTVFYANATQLEVQLEQPLRSAYAAATGQDARGSDAAEGL